ncbi:MAG: MFS transporter [Rhodospirillaceae bacterium]|nr:MFS transporter [Rhodospirillaceae bacterium]
MSAFLTRFLNVHDIPLALTFAVMSGVLILGLAIPFTVIPLLALELLGDAQRVSAFYLVAGVIGLVGALVVPMMIDRFGRRWVSIGSTLCIVAAAIMMPTRTVWALYLGTILYTFGFFAIDIAINVAIMERIPRKTFVRFEAVRMACLGAGFTLGPWLGVFISDRIGLWSPFFLMGALTTLVCIYALARGFVVDRKSMGSSHSNPLRFIPRFLRQPRLKLAYVLALFRSSWWNIFFIYAPIYCVENGFSDEDAGLVVSLGAASVMFAPLWSRMGVSMGMRRFLALGYVSTGIVALVMAALSSIPTVGVALLIGACVCASWLDAVGNSPFVRAVRLHERPEMMSLYTTYRDVGRIIPQGAFSVILLVFPLPAVFVVTGAGMLTATWFTRYIPKRY